MKMLYGYLFATASMLVNVACQQFLSRSFKNAGAVFGQKRGMRQVFSELVQDYRLWTGGLLAGLCLLFWALALSQLAISRVLPMMALVFVLSPLVSHFLFEEKIGPMNVVGFVVICAGIILASR